jgi:TonB family protein
MKHLLAATVLVLVQLNQTPFAQNANTNSNQSERVYSGKEVDQRAVIKEPRPSAKYTRQACKKGIRGLVLLQAVLTSKGVVEEIEVINGLPEGLTESAIEATHKIKFTPALKDGHPVSVRMKLEIDFFSEGPPPPRCPDR